MQALTEVKVIDLHREYSRLFFTIATVQHTIRLSCAECLSRTASNFHSIHGGFDANTYALHLMARILERVEGQSFIDNPKNKIKSGKGMETCVLSKEQSRENFLGD